MAFIALQDEMAQIKDAVEKDKADDRPRDFYRWPIYQIGDTLQYNWGEKEIVEVIGWHPQTRQLHYLQHDGHTWTNNENQFDLLVRGEFRYTRKCHGNHDYETPNKYNGRPRCKNCGGLQFGDVDIVSPNMKRLFVEYEIRASWWAHLVGWYWVQRLAGYYFAWKVNHKYKRYARSIQQKSTLKKLKHITIV